MRYSPIFLAECTEAMFVQVVCGCQMYPTIANSYRVVLNKYKTIRWHSRCARIVHSCFTLLSLLPTDFVFCFCFICVYVVVGSFFLFSSGVFLPSFAGNLKRSTFFMHISPFEIEWHLNFAVEQSCVPCCCFFYFVWIEVFNHRRSNKNRK